MFAIIFNMELISIVLGLGAMALPVVCMVPPGEAGPLGRWQLFPHHAGGDVPAVPAGPLCGAGHGRGGGHRQRPVSGGDGFAGVHSGAEPGRLSLGPAARAQIEKGLPAKTALFPVHQRFSSTAATSWRVMKLWGRKLPSASPRIRSRARTDSTAAWAQGETGFFASSAK